MAARAETLPALAPASLAMLAAAGAAALYQWGLLLALARLGTPELVGRYALAVAIAGPPMALSNLQLRTLLATDARRSHPWRSYLRLRCVATAVALTVILPAGVEVAEVAAVKGLESLADLYHGVLQREERVTTIAAAWWLKGALGVAAFGSAVHATGRLPVALAVLAAVHLLVLAAVERRAAGPGLSGDSGDRRDLARLALPLGAILGTISLLSAAPRYFVGYYHGPAALGRFAALASFAAALQAALSAVGQAASARLAVAFHYDRAAFLRLTRELLALAVLAGLAALAATPVLTRLAGQLYGPDYAGQGDLLAWLILAGAAGSVSGMLGVSLTAARVLTSQVILYGLAVAVCCGLCLGGLHPAAALALASLLLAAGQALLLREVA